MRALSLVTEVIHGAPCRFSDPARYALAHGGKDRHPFPVPTKVYDETIGVLKSAVAKARLGRAEELGGAVVWLASSRASSFVTGQNIVVEFLKTSLPDNLRRRLDVVDFATPVQSVEVNQTGSQARVAIKVAGQDMNFSGAQYLAGYALPNFYFHLTTAYNILRHNGLEIGKGDYMGRA